MSVQPESASTTPSRDCVLCLTLLFVRTIKQFGIKDRRRPKIRRFASRVFVNYSAALQFKIGDQRR